jgi:hypothetical protein
LDSASVERELTQTSEQRYQIAVAGADWAIRQPNSNSVIIRREDLGAVYTERRSPSSETKLDKVLQIKDPSGTYEAEFATEPWRRILRCGVIPSPAIEKFAKSASASAIFLPPRIVNGIDVEVVQWEIDQKLFNELFGDTVPKSMYVADTGFFRMFIAPKLGYCITRTEFVSHDGVIHHFYQASEFKEYSSGLFLPSNFEHSHWDLPMSWSNEFVIHSVQSINVPLDPALFNIPVTEGTRVRCAIHGKESNFMLKQATSLDTVDTVLTANVAADTPKHLDRLKTTNHWRVILGSVNVVAICGVILLWWMRGRKTPISG